MDREKEAWEQLRRVRVEPGAKWILPLVFLAGLVAVFAVDLWNPYGLRDAWRTFSERSRPLDTDAGILQKGLAWNRENLADIEVFEDQIAEESILRETVPYYQWFFARVLSTSGTGRVLMGRDHWLFLKEATETTLGWGDESHLKSADRAVRRLAGILRAGGAELILVPVPGKAEILPWKFSPGFQVGQHLPPIPSLESVYENWDALPGVKVVPVREILSDRTGPERLPFLARDTHWTPEAMEAVTQWIAHSVVGDHEDRDMKFQRKEITAQGDLVGMMRLPGPIFNKQTVSVNQLPSASEENSETATGPKVFYMGDSFTAIYSDPVLGWGEGAGLQDLLPVLLKHPVDFRLNYGDPVADPGRQLESQLKRGPMPEIVIWQFAERFVNQDGWSKLFKSQ